ncbi:MAG TPA: YceI family protein [Steroidobacteraceae bacterium]|nr:YceI family protein [Steroidobacteraceae bacterium]
MALIASGAHAAGAQAQSINFADVMPGTYRVEPGHSQVVFSLLHFGISNYSGMFAGASGTLQLDPGNLGASKLEVSVAVSSISTTVPVLTEELKGHDWFDVADFPVATFVSTSVVPTGKNSAKIAGNLTLHGVTKPVVLNAQLIGASVNPLSKAYSLGFEVTGTIKRGDFGISAYLPAVGDEVRLRIAGAFEAKK